MSTEIFNGVNLHWGLGSTTVTVTNAIGIYQDAGYNKKIEKNESRNQRGAFNGNTYFNDTEHLTLTWLASDANPASGSAAISSPGLGTSISITSDMPFSGSGWKVDDISAHATNTGNTTVTGQFTRYPNF
jgi:hypothetical protein